MAQTESTPVLVAGGGPAGLAAAAELAHHGVGCLLIEPRAQVSHRRPRAKTTSVRTMEHLRRWGVADALRAAAPLPVAWSQRVTFCESLAGRRRSDPRPNFNLVFRAPGLDTHLGPAVQYWVVGASLGPPARTGLIGRLVRPDQHIAWRAGDPAGLDIETAAGLHLDTVRGGL